MDAWISVRTNLYSTYAPTFAPMVPRSPYREDEHTSYLQRMREVRRELSLRVATDHQGSDASLPPRPLDAAGSLSGDEVSSRRGPSRTRRSSLGLGVKRLLRLAI